jgi:hypothetical protein
MKRVALILIPMTLLLSGCTVVTSYKNYEICQNSRERTIEDDSIWVYVPIYGTTSSKTIFPLVYDIDTRKEPYRCHFTIWGNFQEIKSASASFILNGQKQSPLPLKIEKMNNDRKKGNATERFLFPAGGFDLPFIWENIESLEMDVHFIAVDLEGNEVKYEEKKVFKKRLNKRKGNRVWDTMMSV